MNAEAQVPLDEAAYDEDYIPDEEDPEKRRKQEETARRAALIDRFAAGDDTVLTELQEWEVRIGVLRRVLGVHAPGEPQSEFQKRLEVETERTLSIWRVHKAAHYEKYFLKKKFSF